MPPRSNESREAISSADNSKATATFASILLFEDDFGITAQPFWRAHLNKTQAGDEECALAALRTAGWSSSAAAKPSSGRPSCPAA